MSTKKPRDWSLVQTLNLNINLQKDLLILSQTQHDITKMAARRYDVHIQRTTSSDDSRLIVVQTPAMQSQLDKDPDSLTFSMKPKSLKIKLECNNGKNVYTTTKNNIEDSQLFVCKVVNDKLICQPVSQIVTLRSDFSHLNPKDEVDPREEIKPVSIKFSANDRHHAPTRVNLSKPDPDEILEEYQEYSFRNSRGKYATTQRDQLFGKETKTRIKPDPDAMQVDVKPEILPDIKPKIEKMDVDDVYADETEQTSQIPQKKVDLIRQRVKECLLKAKLVSFHEVYQFLESYHELPSVKSSEHDRLQLCTKTIIDALVEYAVLVQGNWAIKTRDYLLWLFDQNPLVSRPAYTRKVRIPDYDVMEVFNQLAVFRRDLRKWELKLPTDHKFLERYSKRVDQQKTFWRIRRANKLRIFD